jgi:tetratricopeptide (TPR) repeat protein
MKLHRLAAIGGVVLMAALMMSCNKLKARDQLNKGVTAFRNAQFQTAITHFKNAVELDPTLLNARLYLATAYSQLYVPGGESEDNLKVGKQAIAAYEDVLQRDPTNTNAMASIAQIYYGMKDFEKAKGLQQRILKVEPNNPDPYNWIGQLDWAICYPRRMEVRKDLKIANPKDPTHPSILPPLPAKARQELQDQNGPLVEEGIKALQKALELRPNDFTALSYLNLMYREKADLEENPTDRDADLAKADELVQKALGVKKAEQAQASTTAQ